MSMIINFEELETSLTLATDVMDMRPDKLLKKFIIKQDGEEMWDKVTDAVNKSFKRLLLAVTMLGVSIINYILSSHNLADSVVTICISVLVVIVCLPLSVMLMLSIFKSLSSNKKE